ncbi:glutathione transferase GstA [Massilia horti]|uniref:Glutathione transferase GstA n=1 Tax=Massilia horti TaxID=2562153 RepID=A0A4Y9T062_9BURK|nr:glutathione transferase GstA [Massilia horti]TFW32402.1 glutathione transferase GstA [Massilia horti]
MKLYFSPGACSLSPHISLIEAGFTFTTERVDLGTKLTASGADFRAINPKGYVPALQLNDGTVLTEAPAILQYIADQAPASNLVPVAGIERYRVLEWLNFISTELHKNFSPLFNKTASEDMKQAARANLANRFGYVERMLEGQDYLTGSAFTAADTYLFTVASWAGFVQLDLSPWPAVQAFLARVAARPAVQQALRAEGLLK